MGGKNDDQEVTQTNRPAPHIEQAQKGIINQADALYANGQGPIDPNTAYAPLNPMMSTAINRLSTFGDQLGGASVGQLQDTLSGAYMNANPYLADMAGMASDNVMSRINATFGGAGRVGGGLHQQALAEGIGNATAGIYAPAYESERDRQFKGVALGNEAMNPYQAILQGGQIKQDDAYRSLMADIAGQNQPYTNLSSYADLINSITPGAGGTSTETTPGRGALAGGIGGAMTGSMFGPIGAAVGGGLGLLGFI